MTLGRIHPQTAIRPQTPRLQVSSPRTGAPGDSEAEYHELGADFAGLMLPRVKPLHQALVSSPRIKPHIQTQYRKKSPIPVSQVGFSQVGYCAGL